MALSKPLSFCDSLIQIVVLLIFTSSVHSQSCNTDQNPTCRGQSAFNSLCCPYPSVCYWADRYRSVGCCPSGQTCLGANGPIQNNNGVTTYPYTTITSTYTGAYTTTGAAALPTVTTTVVNQVASQAVPTKPSLLLLVCEVLAAMLPYI